MKVRKNAWNIIQILTRYFRFKTCSQISSANVAIWLNYKASLLFPNLHIITLEGFLIITKYGRYDKNEISRNLLSI